MLRMLHSFLDWTRALLARVDTTVPVLRPLPIRVERRRTR